MSIGRVWRTAWRWLRSGLGAIYPLVPAWTANRQIQRDSDQRADSNSIKALRETGLDLDDSARAELLTLYSDDVARLQRLEDKLSGQMPPVALLSGAASVVGGAALSQRNVGGLVFVGCAIVWLVSAGLLVMKGSKAIPLYMPDPVAAVEEKDLDLPQRLAADRLQALSLNAARGWQLANALYAAQRSIVVAILLLVGSGLFTAAHQFSHGR